MTFNGYRELQFFNVKVDENDSHFDPDFKKYNSDENLVTLLRSRSAYIEQITKLINKINEKLSLNDNIKCLEEQLYQIFKKLKSLNDEYVSFAMSPKDIENASEIYFEQHSRVIDTSESIEHFVKKNKRFRVIYLPFNKNNTVVF